MTPDRQKQTNTGTKRTGNSTTVTDLDNVLHHHSCTGNSLQKYHCTNSAGSSSMALPQQANRQIIHLHPHLPNPLHQQTFNNCSEQRHIINTRLTLQPILDNNPPQFARTPNYQHPTFETFVTHNPAYPQNAYEKKSYEPQHLTPTQQPPIHSQEQLPFNQRIGS